jgi:hypothetical protein
MQTTNYEIQQAIKRLLESRTPQIKQTFDSNNGRSLEITIKSKKVTISTEMHTPKTQKRGSFR